MNKILLFIISILIGTSALYSQVEDVPISNSVYDFLLRLESRGFAGHYSLSQIPLQKAEIIEILQIARQNDTLLSKADKSVLTKFELEFGIIKNDYSVVFPSKSNDESIFWSEFFGNKEKVFYYTKTQDYVSEVRPLGAFEYIQSSNSDSNQSIAIGTLGVRFSGSVGDNLGFFLQATNGREVYGDKQLVMFVPEYSKSIKFTRYDSDIDLTQSHITYQNGWFKAKIGRMEEKFGAGLFQSAFLSTKSPAVDALTLTAKFDVFKYSYYFGSLIGNAITEAETGFTSKLNSKYFNQHRFVAMPSWGEISLWESVIYSERGLELAYLNPLSFFKSLEHQLHDRDNTLIGMDFTLNFIKNLSIKSSFLLDDIQFEEIGTGYWSNKTAFNIAGIYSSKYNFDFGLEYARVEPYTYSHFNPKNAYTNDNLLLGSVLQPNSEQFGALFQYWWGQKIPLKVQFTYSRHGDNIYDSTGFMIKNVGGDVLYSRRNEIPEHNFAGDSMSVTFLDGILQEKYILNINFGWEFIRDYFIIANYQMHIQNKKTQNYIRILLTINQF
jgi:hypothetical protein